MTTDVASDPIFPGSEEYSAEYYGNGGKKANYTNYNERSTPHWALPLARWIALQGKMPVIDIGCAFGHLVRNLNQLGIGAYGVEWSKYAWQRRVSPHVERADARLLPFAQSMFAVVVSLDLLEHFVPEDTCRVMDEMCRVAKPDALMVHLIGAHNPTEDLSRHLEDPTHKNHWPLETYIDEFAKRGVVVDSVSTAGVASNGAWCNTDWRDRILVFRRK